jgi:CBS domain-containing protein
MHVIALGRVGEERLAVPGSDPWYAQPTDPALGVMTDFRERASVTVSEHATIDQALDHMKHNGVRCAFALDDERRGVSGLITAYDIMGELPMRHMQAVGIDRRHVLVRDLMTRTADWQVADVREIEAATVASVAELFERLAVTHVPVVETTVDGQTQLRGLLSAANVRRLLSRHRAILEYRRAHGTR